MRLSDELVPQMTCKKIMNLELHPHPLANKYGSVAKNLCLVAKKYDSEHASHMCCKKLMNLEHHSQPLVKTYGSVAGSLCLLAGSVCRARDNTNHKKNTTFCNESNYKYFITFL